MKKPLLTACLSLSFLACQETAPVQPVAKEVRASLDRVELPLLPPPPPAAPPVVEDPLAFTHEDLSPVDHLARARELRELGSFPQAMEECRKALFHLPTHEEALLAVSRLAPLSGDTDLALSAYQRLSTLHPEDAFPLIRQARILLGQGKLEEARVASTQAQERDPENAEVYQVLGRIHLSQGALGSAVESFKRVLAIAPEHPYALNNLGLALLRANENEEAAQHLKKASELLPQVAYVQNNLGVALERLGRTDEARDAYGLATSLSPKYVKARINVQRMAQAPAPSDPSSLLPSPLEPAMETMGE